MSRCGRSAPGKWPAPSRRRRRSRSSARWWPIATSRRRRRRGFCTAAPSSRRTPPNCCRCPTSMVRSWAARRWTRRRSRRSRPRPRDERARRVEKVIDGVDGPRSLPAQCACLIVLDGWGLAEPGPGNAVSLARTPIFDGLWESYPHTTLTACGRAVGLPEGQMGNSEVGHLNLGAGAVVRQDLVRIDDAVADGSLMQSEQLRAAFGDAERVHLIGLVSDGGVHSSLEHLRALIAMGRALAVNDLVVHAFTDGRDTLPHAGVSYLRELDGTPGVRVG